MISIKPDSNIYIYCPANHETGGTELAHQLADYLISKNREAYMIYFENNTIIHANVPNGFKKYKINTTTEIVDDSKNVIVLPEVSFSFVENYKNIQFIFWWMSVDNFFSKSTFFDYVNFYKPYDSLKLLYVRLLNKQKLFNGFSVNKLKKIKNNNLHVYQSTYAKAFLIKNHFTDILPLSDYVNSEFSLRNESFKNKENIILYNPAKGFRITKKIIRKLTNFNFIPLVKLSRTELSDHFNRAKVYIDFGNHPGKDRMPREAVIHNCCIIVGKDGSANFFEDIPILNKYKINSNNINEIVKTIKLCVKNYEEMNGDFDFYRRRILNEKRNFHLEINDIFNID